VLLEVHARRLEKLTVVRRRVPAAIATDTGLVLVDPHFGHLNLSSILLAMRFSLHLVTSIIRWDEKAGLRRDAVRSQVIDVLEAQEIKETGNEED
jgi:hypothetical protein